MGKCPDCGVWDALDKVVSQPLSVAAGQSLLDGPSLGGSDFNGPAGDGSSGDGNPFDRPGLGAADWTPWQGSAADEAEASHDESGSRNDHAGIAQPLVAVSLEDVQRLPTGVAELDRVLGGGLVPGSVVLLGGDPGIGKSTLLLQAVAGLASSARQHRILYVSSEESARQVRLRAERLFDRVGGDVGDKLSAEAGAEAGAAAAGRTATPRSSAGQLASVSERLFVLSETNLARIIEQTRRVRPAVVVVDSLQMVFRPGIEAGPGSVTQLRRCCIELVTLAKRTGTVVLIVGHVTKDGQLAGPRLVEHLVDVVLGFEGDRHHAYRIVRAAKNRFGDTLEIGLFEMTGSGLEQVADPGSVVDPTRPAGPGSVSCPTIHGSRCLLAEIQALTSTGILGAARRKASGVDASRVAMLIAVLEKHGGLRLADQDIFVAAGAGLRISEPAGDLAIALAIAGVHYGRSLGPGVTVVGEVALSGQLRPVSQIAQRVREAHRRGFTSIVVPQTGVIPRTGTEQAGGDARIVRVDRLGQAIELLT